MKDDIRPRISKDYEQDAAHCMFKIEVQSYREPLVFILHPLHIKR
jgi:hypothetical protein